MPQPTKPSAFEMRSNSVIDVFFERYPEDLHRFGDIFDLLLAHQLEAEGEFLLDFSGYLFPKRRFRPGRTVAQVWLQC
jgi:hypothetical protein